MQMHVYYLLMFFSAVPTAHSGDTGRGFESSQIIAFVTGITADLESQLDSQVYSRQLSNKSSVEQ